MRKPATVAALLMGLVLQGCGSSEAPEAYPGRPVDPPRKDDALLDMMAGGPTTPATAEPTAAPTAAPSASAAPTASATVAVSASATAGPKTQPKPKPKK
ncbi:MAG: hypothetical protein IPM79_31115 [Polyangiaceae bacterium]|jgi:hypothetical protein|nr:hypothetical protein [Polyangiaceae bacterium]MBK8941935.1 hypothetical protein [Polyangiaceae bacterium]